MVLQEKGITIREKCYQNCQSQTRCRRPLLQKRYQISILLKKVGKVLQERKQ